MTNYWQVNNRKWIDERKLLWLPLKKRLVGMEEFDNDQLNVFESYFITGKMDFTGDYRDVVPLVYMFAWHPSNETAVWLAEFNKMKSRVDAEDSIPYALSRSYELIKSFGTKGTYFLENAASDCFMKKEKELFEIFFDKPSILGDFNSINGFSTAIDKTINQLFINAFSYPNLALNDNKTEVHFLEGFPRYILPKLKFWLTDEIYDRYASSIKGNFEVNETKLLLLKKRLYHYYHLSLNCSALTPEMAKIIGEWVTQIEAPEVSLKWRTVWEEVKKLTSSDIEALEKELWADEEDDEDDGVEEFNDEDNVMIDYWPQLIKLCEKYQMAVHKENLPSPLTQYHHLSSLLCDLTGLTPIDFGNLTEIIDEPIESLITQFFESVETATNGKIKINNLSIKWIEEEEELEVSFKTGLQLKPFKFEIEVEDCFRFIDEFTDWLKKQLKKNIIAVDTDTCSQVFMLPKELAMEIKSSWPMDHEHYERIVYPE
ncbi:hypothetical protein [Pseudoalteromonas sp. T1lg24]|uniref:hypothetical protein n=1 Tax=Pseudoalteromonas sp. T1lg24 TaxID=2077099 RepID=UPI000CF6CCF2|nr:hypothetical protein [Pseudoalteromonas sp. T1lg24]